MVQLKKRSKITRILWSSLSTVKQNKPLILYPLSKTTQILKSRNLLNYNKNKKYIYGGGIFEHIFRLQRLYLRSKIPPPQALFITIFSCITPELKIRENVTCGGGIFDHHCNAFYPVSARNLFFIESSFSYFYSSLSPFPRVW